MSRPKQPTQRLVADRGGKVHPLQAAACEGIRGRLHYGAAKGRVRWSRRNSGRFSSGDRVIDRMPNCRSASEQCCDSARLNIIKTGDRV